MTDGRASRTVTARAPVRIDLGGGWTDVPPYPEEQGGFVTAVAVTRYATASVRLTPNAPSQPTGTTADDIAIVAAARRAIPVPGAQLTLRSDFPQGAGLGGSSAASVALLAALSHASGRPIAGPPLAERSRRFEVDDLGIAGGFQDHYAAALGGALAMRFARQHAITPLELSDAARGALERSMLLYYSGASRISATTITAVRDGYRQHDPGTRAALSAMRRLAEQMVAPLVAGDIAALGALVGEHWLHQRALHHAITTPRLDEIIHRALQAGAYGAKALGASGGGCVVILAPPETHPAMRAALDPLGEHLPVQVAIDGCTVDAA